MCRIYSFLLTLLLFLMTVPMVSQASLEARVRVYAIKGKVTTQLLHGEHDGKLSCPLERELNSDETEARIIGASFRLKTGNNSYAYIEFQNPPQIVKVGPNTELKIIANKIYVNSGRTWFKVERTLKGGLIVKTPTAIAGIRGTEFLVNVKKDGTSTIGLIKGKIAVSDIHQQSTMNLVAGMEVTVVPGSSTLNTNLLKIKERDKWWTDWPTLVPISEKPGYSAGPVTNSSKKQILPVADAYVYAYNYRNWNRSNRGKYDQLIAGWHPTGGESRAYIKFDLSNIDPSKVKKAALRLYHFQTAGGSGIDLGIYRVTGPWQEGTDTYHSGRIEKTAAPGEISWVQQPPADSRPIVSFNPGRGLGDWVDVDITPLVKEWLAGMPNYGLVVKSMGYLTRSTPESVYYFASRERRSDLDNPKGKSKAPVLILSENPNVKNAITQPPQKIPDTEITKSTFSCKDRDNEERGCCCFKGTHTYRFGARYVTKVLARFDTGRGLNCRSTVNLDVDRGNGWETVKTVQANSSRRGSERAPIDVLVPVNGTIKGFRLSDGCACCLDSSKITLNANYTGGGFPQPSGFQRALGKPCGTDREFVRSLYQSVLERDLEVSFAPGHGAAHLRSLQNGASREAITKAFFNSPEYRKKQKSNRDFIRDVYQAVLGREPNSAELNRRIGTSRNDFISMIFNSAEYHNIIRGCH